MKHTKRNIVIALNKPSSSSRIYVTYRVTCLGKRLNLHSGITLTCEKQWDEKASRVKRGVKVDGCPYSILNSEIDTHLDFINDYFNDCDMRGQAPSLDDLRDRFLHAFKEKSDSAAPELEFSYIFDKYMEIKSKERSWDQSMKDKHTRLRDRLLKVKKDLKLTDLSDVMMNKVLDEFATTMYNDAIAVQLSSLKRFVRWAKAKGYPINEDCLNFNPKLPSAKKAVRFLTLKELDKINSLELEKDSALDRTRDMFMFQCGTALRYSDLKQMKKDNISVDDEGNLMLRKLTEKDDDIVYFPLCTIAKNVYLKYKDRDFDDGTLLPIISNQKYNDHLKELGEKAGLTGEWIDYEYKLNKKIEVRTPKKDITSHSARRTFVVTALNEGVSADMVALVTSHSDLKAMKPYIKINARGTKAVIDAFNRATEDLGKE